MRGTTMALMLISMQPHKEATVAESGSMTYRYGPAMTPAKVALQQLYQYVRLNS